MSDVERTTNKQSSGTALVQLDGGPREEVTFLFTDNFRTVWLGKNGKGVIGHEAVLHLSPPYNLLYKKQQGDQEGFWDMQDSFVS